jgi:hypothetical protein
MLGFNNINERPNDKYILESQAWQTVIIIVPTIQKIIVDPILLYILIVSLRFLLSRYLENKANAGLNVSSNFYIWRVFLIIVILQQISVSIFIVLLRIYAIPFFEQNPNAFITNFFSFFSNVYYPISNYLKSIGALFLAVYLCEQ